MWREAVESHGECFGALLDIALVVDVENSHLAFLFVAVGEASVFFRTSRHKLHDVISYSTSLLKLPR